MSSIKNVAILGASGGLGAPILKALLFSKKFNVTVITRTASSATFSEGANIISVDYTSLEELTSALTGQDAVVSVVAPEGIFGQRVLLDAAIAAGVKHFLPSEYGCDTTIPKVAKLAAFSSKMAFRQYLEEKVAGGAKIAYTYVVNNAFLDWGIEYNFIFNWKERKPEIFDSGDQLWSSTTLSAVGQAIVGVLSHPKETKNRQVIVHSRILSQNMLLEIAKKVDPKQKWEPVPSSSKELEKWAQERIDKGDYSKPVIYSQLQVAVFGEGYGQPYLNDDNELLGITPTTDAEIEDVFKRFLL